MKSINILNSFVYILIAFSVFISCQKDMGPPNISFVEGEGFLSQDTMLMVGDTIKIGVVLEWNETDKLRTLDVYASEQLLQSYHLDIIDRGEYSFNLMKSFSEEELWKFTLIDEKGNEASASIVLSKDPNSIYGPVKYFDDIRLGAQNNVFIPGFLSLSGALRYDLEGAFQNQETVDLIYYHSDDDQACVTSPGANIQSGIFSGDASPENWSTRNTTRFIKTEITPEQFENIFHDGLIIPLYSDEDAKRKAKELIIDNVYVFKTESGLFGAFLVKSLDGTHDGEIGLGIKIQGNPDGESSSLPPYCLPVF
ncbi:MAG: hypothetical protein U9N86_14765 [Bacteroidota bacterium]|nr:hypothetical protein [Bacteroidota bacterium]